MKLSTRIQSYLLPLMKMNSKVAKFKEIMDSVYGAYTANWQPAQFEEDKSRYLWTDAYGVCNYLTLYKETGHDQYINQAKILIGAVHDTLGKTRDATRRLGSATPEHPLIGGLRIGKSGSEGPGMSEDGQYFHYLTKWMFALNRMSLVVGEKHYNEWAIEMVRAVHFKFCTRDRQRMIWKMSIDLSTPLTHSEGGLDTFDGLTMYLLLQETAKAFDKFEQMPADEKKQWEETHLKSEIDHMKSLVASRIEHYVAHDTLDAGEALWLAHFFPDLSYSKKLKEQASYAIDILWKRGAFEGSAQSRLAFREFGTTIGVQMHADIFNNWQERVDKLHHFWLKRLQLRDNDITPIMVCTSLIPGVFQKSYLSFAS